MPLSPSGVPSRAAIQAAIDEATSTLGIRARGTVTVSVTTSAGGTAPVTFPVGRFSTPPRVFVTKQSGNLAQFVPYVTAVTVDGCTVGVYAGDGVSASGSVTIVWEAVEG